ncbi:MAG: carboxypeptidase regulatory-like domain-containing protein, partial [Rubrobacteridae bacterium]|nr:carboxypeptidase regulatory-like domain-containing protein [Rubrobacteridae bacterium]
PINSASVRLVNNTTGEIETTSTTSGGTCSLDLVAGVYSLEVSKTGYNTNTGTVTIISGGSNFPITLSVATYAATFTVKDNYNYSIENAAIHLVNNATGAITDAVTDSSGQLTTSLIAGSYSLQITKADHSTLNDTITISTSGNTFLRTLTAITYASTFTVRNSGSSPISGASVSLTNTYNGATFSGTTNASGQCTVNPIVGTYTVVVTKTGYDTNTSTRTIASGGSNYTITLTAPATGNIRVRVLRMGSPINYLDVRVRQGSTTIGPVTPDSNGYAYFNNLAPGSYTVERESLLGGWTDWYIRWGSPIHYSNPVTVTAGSTTECWFEIPL